MKEPCGTESYGVEVHGEELLVSEVLGNEEPGETVEYGLVLAVARGLRSLFHIEWLGCT